MGRAGGSASSVVCPAGVMRPILLMSPPAVAGVNQRLPSGPAVMPAGEISEVGKGNSAMIPAGGWVGSVVADPRVAGCEPHAATMTAVTRSAIRILGFIAFLNPGDA